MKDIAGAFFAVVFLFAFGLALFYVVQAGEKNQTQADKNCGPYKCVTWFHDNEGEIKSVCMNSENNYVVKP